MREFLLFLLVLAGCRPIDPAPQQAHSPGSPEKIYFPCDLFNFSSEWEYCTPVSIDLTDTEFTLIEMNYNFRNQRGGESVVQAELYDLGAGEPIPFSFTESTQVYTMHTRTTEDLSGYFSNRKYSLVIRFRSSVTEHAGYVSDNSHIAIY